MSFTVQGLSSVAMIKNRYEVCSECALGLRNPAQKEPQPTSTVGSRALAATVQVSLRLSPKILKTKPSSSLISLQLLIQTTWLPSFKSVSTVGVTLGNTLGSSRLVKDTAWNTVEVQTEV